MIKKPLIYLTTIALTVVVTAASSTGYAMDNVFASEEDKRAYSLEREAMGGVQFTTSDNAISGETKANENGATIKQINFLQIPQKSEIKQSETPLIERQQFATSEPASCLAISQECLGGVTPLLEDKSEQASVEEHPAKFTAADLNEEFLNEVRRSYQGGEGSDNIRSEEYLNRLTQAFHYIYNNLENRGGLPRLGNPNPVYNINIPNFSIGYALNRRRSNDFENYPIVRGIMAENGAAALSMKVKVEIPKIIKTGYLSYESILEPCGPGFYQITMTNNGGAPNIWTTRINPGRQHNPERTEYIAKCLNAEKPEAQTVFSKAPAANTVHIGRKQHPAMIEAIILMVLEGEAKNRYHRLSFYDFSRNEEENLAVLRELVLKQPEKKSINYEDKLINEADFTILNY